MGRSSSPVSVPATYCDRRTLLRRGGAALSTIGIAGCLTDPSDQEPVTMTDDFGFDPTTKTIAPGGTVTWENASDVDHTVTAYEAAIPAGAPYFASGDFESERAARAHLTEGLLAQGAEYEHTFEAPGTYEYYCIPHESSGMIGTIRVE